MDSSATNAMIDAKAIRTYCDLVFGYLAGPTNIRLISETGTPHQQPKVQNSTVDRIAEVIVQIAPHAAQDHRAVFILPVTLNSLQAAKAQNLNETGVIIADLDQGDINAMRAHLARYLGQPSMEVASGGTTDGGKDKLHLYWRLSEAASGSDLDLVARLRMEIAEKVGSDVSFKSMTQPIRVPGTIHGKNGILNPVRLLVHNTEEFHLAEIAEAITTMPPLNKPLPFIEPTGVRSKGRRAEDLMTKIIREGGQDGETRFQALSMIIGHWIRMTRLGHCSAFDAWTAVLDQNAATISPPWPEDRLLREFQALLKLDIAKNGPMSADDHSNGVEPPAPSLSEDALAQQFIRQRGAMWRYVGSWAQWFKWTGIHWQIDGLGGAFHDIRLICRTAARETDKPQDARRLASAKTIQAVQKIVTHDPVIALAPDAFDQHPMLVNTPDGILDLETGSLTKHDAKLLLSQITRAIAGKGCPQWLIFLNTITGGNRDLQAYLARVAGYCLTGSTQEQVFFFLHGSGANGKSVFLQTLAWVLRDYAATATADTFTNRGQTRHLTELAGLRAARLVLVSETEAGEGWAEARIKSITGGETIRANFMYKDHFEFLPQFKLIVAGNHRPSLSEVGEAMRRRLHIIPFAVTIAPEDRNPNLIDALRAEADGIFGWMIEGCADWQSKGLAPPPIVSGAAEDYFAAEDHIGHWLGECCQIGPTLRASAKILYASWSAWAKDGGFEPKTTRFLGEQLRGRGFKQSKVGQDRGWLGLCVRQTFQQGHVA